MAEKYVISIRMNNNHEIGFGVFLDDKPYDCKELNELTEEQLCDFRFMADSVAHMLYHAAFYNKYKECPVCEVKSVFADTDDTKDPEPDTFDPDDCRLCIQNKETPDTCTDTTCEHYGQADK
jgi:hypothetical protein